jgi:hypothetical protein
MSKNKSRFIAIALIFCMVAQILPLSALGAEIQEPVTKNGINYVDVTTYSSSSSVNLGDKVTSNGARYDIKINGDTVGYFVFNKNDPYIEITITHNVAVDIMWNCGSKYASCTLDGVGVYKVPRLLGDGNKAQGNPALIDLLVSVQSSLQSHPYLKNLAFTPMLLSAVSSLQNTLQGNGAPQSFNAIWVLETRQNGDGDSGNLADYRELDDLLDETVIFMEELNEADYTSESWAALLRAVEAARNVDPHLGASSQDILEALIVAINDAIDNLTPSALAGTVRGRLLDTDGTPLANMEFEVRVYVREPVQTMSARSLSLSSLDLVGWTIYTIFTYTTDANGYYYLSLPVGDEYLVQILFTGFLDFVQYIAITDTSRVLELEPVPLIRIGNDEGTGTINGILRDATNNDPISGVTIEVRPNWNNAAGTPITTITTNTNGRYECSLSYGYYTFTASKNDYITAIMNVHIFMNSVEKNYAMNPNDGSQYRIVLTWGANPSDLDSHLVSDIGNVHCWYSNRQPSSAVRLDIDVTTGYGPETTTVYNLAELGGFRYYVHQYSSDSNLWSSNAIVRVYKGVDLIGTYYVPTSSADTSCRYWQVFEMSANGIITDLNMFTRDPTIPDTPIVPQLPQPEITSLKTEPYKTTETLTVEGTWSYPTEVVRITMRRIAPSYDEQCVNEIATVWNQNGIGYFLYTTPLSWLPPGTYNVCVSAEYANGQNQDKWAYDIKQIVIEEVNTAGLDWVREQLGTFYDYDGASGSQCFDLINGYLVSLGKSAMVGASFPNPKSLATVSESSLPSGVMRYAVNDIPGGKLLPGDIFIYTGGDDGHTGVVISESSNLSSFTSIDANWPNYPSQPANGSGGNYRSVMEVEHTNYNIWGILRIS